MPDPDDSHVPLDLEHPTVLLFVEKRGEAPYIELDLPDGRQMAAHLDVIAVKGDG